MKIKNHRDFWAALLFSLAGVVFTIGASHHSLGSPSQPGPGYFPLLLGLMLVLFGCLLFFKALTFETDDGAPVGAIGWRAALVVTASIIAGGILLPRLGMLLTIAVLTWLLGHATQRLSVRHWLQLWAAASLLCWLVLVAFADIAIAWWPALAG